MPIIERGILEKEIKKLIKAKGGDHSSLMPVLKELQQKYGYISPLMMQEVAHALDIHPSEVEGVATFYAFLRTKERQGKYVIRLCKTISCDIAGKDRIARQLENELGIKFGETTKDGMFSLEYTNCLGMCDQGPALMVNNRLFAKVTPDKIPLLIEDCRRGFLRSSFPDVELSDVIKYGPILEHGVKVGEPLKQALKKSSQEVIDMVKSANLRGRGGAGFPTALKWQLAHDEKSEKKFIACNADEGEPGTFKDRYLLHAHTDLIIDGMTIAAYAVGAKKGFLYLRGEYAYLRDQIEEVLEKRRKDNLLGKDILGKKGFEFDIEIRMGAGAYVCGEETALIESIEGLRGEPRNRPPYPVDTGFQNVPTPVNNVETFAAAALICAKGSKWFKVHGTEKSTGTKFFSVSGDCEKQGIFELPFGITIDELLKEVGGENAKAVQVGGAAGRCVARHEFKDTIAFEAIPTGGSIIVFGPGRDMLEVAKNFMDFFVEESCGQCTPCREGNVKLLEGIELLEQGRCSMTYLNELIGLAETMQVASKCGLGQSSPNAFLSIVKNFKEEVLGRLPKEVE